MSQLEGLTLTHKSGGAVTVFFNAACAPVMFEKEITIQLSEEAADGVTTELQIYAQEIGMSTDGEQVSKAPFRGDFGLGSSGINWRFNMPNNDYLERTKIISSWFVEDKPKVNGTVILVPGIDGSIDVVQTLAEITCALKDGVTSLHNSDRFQKLVTESSKPIADKTVASGKEKLDQIKIERARPRVANEPEPT